MYLDRMFENKIYVLVATIFNNVKNIDFNNFPSYDNVKYIFNCQCDNDIDVDYVLLKYSNIRTDIQFYAEVSSGLSVNRNSLLKKVTSGIGIIADDDVLYSIENFKRVFDSYRNYKNDFITFMIETPKNENRKYKKYSGVNFNHTALSLMSVSSIEITFNIERVISKNIYFDTRFGLGSNDIPKYEESIFLFDLKKSGLKGLFLNEYLVTHPYESSGKVVGYQNIKQLRDKFCYLYRYFGMVGIFLSFGVIVKNYNVLKFGFSNVIYTVLNSVRYSFNEK